MLIVLAVVLDVIHLVQHLPDGIRQTGSSQDENFNDPHTWQTEALHTLGHTTTAALLESQHAALHRDVTAGQTCTSTQTPACSFVFSLLQLVFKGATIM